MATTAIMFHSLQPNQRTIGQSLSHSEDRSHDAPPQPLPLCSYQVALHTMTLNSSTTAFSVPYPSHYGHSSLSHAPARRRCEGLEFHRFCRGYDAASVGVVLAICGPFILDHTTSSPWLPPAYWPRSYSTVTLLIFPFELV